MGKGKAKAAATEAVGDGPGEAGPATAGQRVRAFAIEKPDLPPEVEAGVLTSGGYPYDKPMKKEPYEAELQALQIELLKLQAWAKATGARVVVTMDGRDGAGKGGAIQRVTEHLNPRSVRVVALAKPSEQERGQWYFQRYVAQLPAAGEMVLFDRSWHNRAGVERVMGFTPEATVQHYLAEVPGFERMLVRDGVHLVKLWLTVGRETQMARLHARFHDPLKRWKLSPIDFEAVDRWDAYSGAFDAMLETTEIEEAPWIVVRANDKRRARLAVIRAILDRVPYEGRDAAAAGEVDRRVVLSAGRFLDKGGEV